jgi:nitrogen fixation protein FixH
MNNLFKLISILFVLSLLALPLTGCDSDSGMILVVKVDTPKDGSTVNTPTVTVSGRVKGTESKGAKVSINNIDAPVTDGKYSANVTLNEGKNIINIVAKSGQAAPTETLTVTYAPAKQ